MKYRIPDVEVIMVIIAMAKAEIKKFLKLLTEVPEYRRGNVIKYSLRDV